MMDSFELNKIAGAVLATLLFLMGLGIIANSIFSAHAPKKSAYALPEASDGPATAAPAKKELNIAALLPAADVKKGASAAKAACSSCHTFTKGGAVKQGPNLYNILGKPIASTAGFSYSKALKDYAAAEKNWGFKQMAAFINNPRKTARGTKMAYAGMKNEGRLADIVAYLRSLSDKPLPLPKVEPAAAEAPKKDTAKTDAGKKPAPKAAAPKPDAPKTAAPKAAAPKPDAPKPAAPKPDAPKPAPK